MIQKNRIITALKGVFFLGAFYYTAWDFPILLLAGFPFSLDSMFNTVGFLLIMATYIAVIFFLLRSKFFAHVRQRLKPIWYPAVLIWLIALVGLLPISSILGMSEYGFPWPICMSGYDESWFIHSNDAFPFMVMMLVCLAVARLLVNRIGAAACRILRPAVVFVFIFLCAASAYKATWTFKPGTTWSTEEIIFRLIMPRIWIFAMWFGLALVPVWRMVGELLTIKIFASEPENSADTSKEAESQPIEKQP